jgi:hypothetical protein
MVETLLATCLCHPFRGGQVFGKVGFPHNAHDALQTLDEVGLIEDRAEAAAVRESLGLHSAKFSVRSRKQKKDTESPILRQADQIMQPRPSFQLKQINIAFCRDLEYVTPMSEDCWIDHAPFLGLLKY